MAPEDTTTKIEEPTTELTDVAITKYKAAAEIAKGALAAVIAACIPGAKLIDLNKIGDAFMIESAGKLYTKGKGKLEVKDKGIAFPTCVAVQDALCHIHPLARYS
jgi:methionine aminopeptidase